MDGVFRQSRVVALTYALMGTWCFVSSTLVVAVDKPQGFWSGLWDYIRRDSYYLGWILAAGLVLWILAVLSFRYRALGRTWRGVTLGLSVCIALWRLGDAVWLTLVKMLGTTAVPPGSILVGRWLLTLVLAICTYALWNSGRASTRTQRIAAMAVVVLVVASTAVAFVASCAGVIGGLR